MTSLEDELKTALRRRQSPEGFADRVSARVAEKNPASPGFFRPDFLRRVFAKPLLHWAAAAALSIGLIAGGVHYRQLQHEKALRERAAGEAAKERLMLALRIAGNKLQLAKSKVTHVSDDPTENRDEKE